MLQSLIVLSSVTLPSHKSVGRIAPRWGLLRSGTRRREIEFKAKTQETWKLTLSDERKRLSIEKTRNMLQLENQVTWFPIVLSPLKQGACLNKRL